MTFKKAAIYEGLATSLLLASVVVNVGLGLRINALMGTISGLKQEDTLKVGTSVSAPVVRDRNDVPTKIDYSRVATPTVLYVFTPQCGWCAKNLRNLKALESQAEGKFRLVGISLSKKRLEKLHIR